MVNMTRDAVGVKDAAERLGMSVSALARWRQEGMGPRYYKIGGAIRYLNTDLDEFIEASAYGG